MAKQTKSTAVPPEMLAKAREQALAKKARIIAEQELGLTDEKAPVVKGPPQHDDPIVAVSIDLAPFVDRVVLDSVHYMQGRVYEMPLRQAQVVKEAMSRTWEHQAEIEGKDSEFYLKNRFANRPVNANRSLPGSIVRQ